MRAGVLVTHPLVPARTAALQAGARGKPDDDIRTFATVFPH